MMAVMKVSHLKNMTAAKDHVNTFLKSASQFSIEVSDVRLFELFMFEKQKKIQVSGHDEF
jgi:hypothetical protein